MEPFVVLYTCMCSSYIYGERELEDSSGLAYVIIVCVWGGGGIRGAFCGAWHSHIVWERKRVGCLLCGACVVVCSSIEREIKFEELFMVL